MRKRLLLSACLAVGACTEDKSSRDADELLPDDGGLVLLDASLSDGAAPRRDGGSLAGDGSASDAGAAEDGQTPDAAPTGDGPIRTPPRNAGFDYQIGGAYPPAAEVGVVSRDRSHPIAPGLYNICYVNGFQAQPEEAEFWLQQQPDLVLRDGRGEPIIDPDWNEMLLDISNETKRARLAQIVGAFMGECRRSGFDAVEVDNLDTFGRSGGRITRANAVAFMRLLADIAHGAGLAIAQKNAAELVDSKEAMGTDFVVAEECNQWRECDVYQQAYGDDVLVIEYQRAAFEAGCAAFPGLSIVLRDVPVTKPGETGYVYEGC